MYVNCIELRRKLFVLKVGSWFLQCSSVVCYASNIFENWLQLLSLKCLFRYTWCAHTWTGFGYPAMIGHKFLTLLFRLG